MKFKRKRNNQFTCQQTKTEVEFDIKTTEITQWRKWIDSHISISRMPKGNHYCKKYGTEDHWGGSAGQGSAWEPDNPSFILGTHGVEAEIWFQGVALWPPHVPYDWSARTHTHYMKCSLRQKSKVLEGIVFKSSEKHPSRWNSVFRNFI